MFSLPDYALEVINTLENAGYEAYAVGGCIRDMLMNRDINDIDITTNALPEEMKRVFSNYHTFDTGLKHGTITVLIGKNPVEVTTYRIDCGYSDGRHPDSVAFTRSIEEDLARRDFTCNAIAYNPKRELVDPFGGRQDIDNMLLRCVGEPQKRFSEDSLRILRALRFSSVLGFTIDSTTAIGAKRCKHLLKNVSSERIYSEISKTLCGKNIKAVLLSYIDIFEEVLPELCGMKDFDQHNFHHIYDVLTHTAVAVETIEPVAHLRLAALFHDCGKPDCFTLDNKGVGHFYSHARKSTDKANIALTRLKSDNFTKNRVTELIKLHDTPIEPERNVIKRKLNKYGEDLFFELIKLQRADNLALSPEFHDRQKTYDEIETIAKDIISQQQCFSLKDLAVKGDDLTNLGLKGRDVGTALKTLLNAVMDEKAPNDKDALLKYYHTRVKSE